MNKINYRTARVTIAFFLFNVIGTILWGSSHASEELQPGRQYKIIGPVYLSAIYLKLSNRQLNRQLAVGDLTAVRFSGPEVAFQRPVPVGTIMTIIGPAPKRLPLPFYANQYYVTLDPVDFPGGLDIILELNRGIKGSLDGLNPDLFARLQ